MELHGLTWLGLRLVRGWSGPSGLSGWSHSGVWLAAWADLQWNLPHWPAWVGLGLVQGLSGPSGASLQQFGQSGW